jgi:hypothetical protein
VRRLTAWIGGALGGIAAYRWLRGRPQPTVEPSVEEPAPAEPDERAEELRAKLAENRAGDESPRAEPDEPPEAVEDRRQRVHEEARSALDEMRSEDPGDGAA